MTLARPDAALWSPPSCVLCMVASITYIRIFLYEYVYKYILNSLLTLFLFPTSVFRSLMASSIAYICMFLQVYVYVYMYIRFLFFQLPFVNFCSSKNFCSWKKKFLLSTSVLRILMTASITSLDTCSVAALFNSLNFFLIFFIFNGGVSPYLKLPVWLP